MGFVELPNDGPDAGSFGEVLVEAPVLKVFGASIYSEAEEKTVSKKDMTLATTSIGAAWGSIELAKVALVTNTEAFFSTPRFKQAIEMAATDTSFSPVNADCWALAKSRQHGIQMINSSPVRLYTECFGRFVIVTNPPSGSKFGAQITDVQGGTLTDRGTTRPFKLMLAMAGKKNVYQKLHELFLGSNIDLPDDSFDAVVAAGVLTHGHAPPESLDGIVSIVRPGGVILFSLSKIAYGDMGFREKMEALTENRSWEELDRSRLFRTYPFSEKEAHLRHWIYSYRKL